MCYYVINTLKCRRAEIVSRDFIFVVILVGQALFLKFSWGVKQVPSAILSWQPCPSSPRAYSSLTRPDVGGYQTQVDTVFFFRFVLLPNL